MSSEPIISARGIWKSYQLTEGLLGLTRRLTGRAEETKLWALKDVGFDVGAGDSLGIVGRNGAGKSTLLKVLAGVTWPTHGEIDIRGRMFPMIELSAGMNRELTGRENVFVLGAIVGISRREIQRRMPKIQEFCELGPFFDLPVRKYSSGMLGRLGFAVAVNVDPDILLVDEVLAVGDPAFQQRCYARILELLRGGVTLLLVSHAFRQIGRLCERTLWLENGEARAYGPSEEVLLQYMNQLQREASTGTGQTAHEAQHRETAHVTRITVQGTDGGQPTTGEEAVLTIHYEMDDPVEDGYFFVQVQSQDNLPLLGFASRHAPPYALARGAGAVRCRIPDLPLLPGVYLFNAGIGRQESNQKLTRGYLQAPVTVQAGDFLTLNSYAGYLRLDHEWLPGTEGE